MTGPPKLGGYELVDKLAVGGMAEIYIAKARSIQGFEKEYVLKLIHPKHSGDTDFMRMLVDEAKLTAQLNHINIAQVIDLGQDDENYFIVMEYVRGRDLHQILNRAFDEDVEVPLDVCAFIAREVAAGLHYAHTSDDSFTGRPLKLVHRDISPQNILVSWMGEVKIVDFGVAKAALAARPETQAGVIKGKFRYMSPEQAWGEKLDGRSDIFSAGLCLYEMATSSMAYEDDPDMRQMLVKMREADFTPPSELRPDIDDELEGIITKALSRRRHERFESAEEFESALTTYLSRRSPGFTRREVRAFFARVFPDEIPYDVPPLIGGLDSNSDPETDPVTQPVSMTDPYGGPTRPVEKEEDVDTDDRTVKTRVRSGDRFDGDFEDESTELWEQGERNETEKLSTANMSDDDVRAILTRAQGLEEARQRSHSTSNRPPHRPAAVPSAWLPEEVPEQNSSMGARAEVSPRATAPPGMVAPQMQNASSSQPSILRRVEASIASMNHQKWAIAVGFVFVTTVLFIVFLVLIF